MSVPDILPPSPPHTSHRDRMPLPLFSKVDASTPDDSPASFLPSSGARKRVEFSSWTNILDAPSSDPPSESSALKTLPRSKDCQPLVKSILKPYTGSDIAALGLDGASDAQQLVTMDSVIAQLAVNDKISSLDAYQSLAQLIKAYDEIPEDSDTKANITTLLKHIKRDLVVQDVSSATPLDMNLVTQALKVSVILVWSEHLSPLLTEDFKIFVTDRAINSLAEHTAPKIIIVHYMHLLATQNFRTVLFTSGTRTVKLLEALKELTNHVQGKGVTSERLLVYQKLIEQARPIMKARAALWIKEVLMGLSSRVWEIQEKAISVGSRACAAFPQSSALSQATREALAESVKDRTLNVILTQRLLSMVTAKDEAVRVPQIWALIMLMCNSTESRLEKWPSLKEWLKVIQRCFNCSDVTVRAQAFPAWNRFIYIMRPHETTDAMLSMLVKPIIAQIERTNASSSGKGTRPAAVSSYCVLLYYAFRPAATHKQYTRAWNEYVVKVATSQFLSKTPANADLCCRALMNLFWKGSTANRIWNENRAHDNSSTEPEELPTIDCKWIRSKAHAIVQVFRLLFLYSSWGPSIQNAEQAFVAKSWRHFLKAIKESASKEIKPSNDTRKALTSIVSFLSDVAYDDNNNNTKPDTPIDRNEISARVRIACGITVAELGVAVVLDALEISEQSVNADLLEVAITSVTQHDSKREANQPETLSTFAQRCVAVLGRELQRQYTTDTTLGDRFAHILEVTCRILRQIQPAHTSQCLQLMEESLAMVLKDHKKVYDLNCKNVRLATAWQNVSNACIDTIARIPVIRFAEFDNLLAAIVSSSNQITANYILGIWHDTDWQESVVTLGPHLEAAIKEIQPFADVNLPGVHPPATACESQFPLQQAEHLDTQITSGTVPESLEQLLAKIVRQKQQPPRASSIVLPSMENQQTEDQGRIGMDLRPPRQRLRHDDSQIHFVAVDSSPRHDEVIESQFLTERQKDVRNRQRTEQAVTFADLRSSPRTRSDRTSRATSVDCELARKAAALQDAPVTPTLPRHTDDIDDEIMPSPTPKAKHHVLRLMDIDVPSSPPSDTGDAPIDNDLVDQDDLHMHDANAQALELVNLEDETGENVHPVHTEQPNVSMTSTVLLEADSVLEVCQLHNSVIQHDLIHGDTTSKNGVTPEIPSSVPSSPELIAEVVPETLSPHPHSALPNPRRTGTDSDELDEASASQLSQDLDWHLMEACRSGISPAKEPHMINVESRKRKAYSEAFNDHDSPHPHKRQNSEKGLISPQTQVISPASQHSRGNLVQLPSVVTPQKESSILHSPTLSTERSRRARTRRGRRTPTHPNSQSTDRIQPAAIAVEELIRDVEQSLDVFHTPTPAQHSNEELDTRNTSNQNEVQQTEPKTSTINSAQTKEIDVMIALRSALNALENDKRTVFDLRAIDDLCFKIRFQAQENAQKRIGDSITGAHP